MLELLRFGRKYSEKFQNTFKKIDFVVIKTKVLFPCPRHYKNRNIMWTRIYFTKILKILLFTAKILNKMTITYFDDVIILIFIRFAFVSLKIKYSIYTSCINCIIWRNLEFLIMQKWFPELSKVALFLKGKWPLDISVMTLSRYF